ncbi:MAG: serine hydrolase domain-containing protein [Saprospiraceae bacterium]|nr:serine hydrolase domain-containing protein [Saprospiraceae bacterium]
MIKPMLRSLFICHFLVLSYSHTCAQSDLRQTITDLMARAEVPGLSLALIHDGEIAVLPFGVKRAGADEPVSIETRFEAASLTKPVFAYAVLRLVDQGVLDLDTPLDKYWLSSEVNTAEWPGVITARMVLTHTTGLPNWRRPRDAGQVMVQYEPGSRYSYSGDGFVWLSRVLEHLTGKKTHVYIQEQVFEPLGLQHSSLVWTDEIAADCASPHDVTGQPADKYRPDAANAAASLHTTAGDYAKFMVALSRGDGLSAESHRLMTSAQQFLDPTCSQCRHENAHPDFRDVSWALGIGIEKGTEDYLWHWGDNGNFKAYVCYGLRTNTGLVYFANGHGGLALRDALVQAILPGEHPAHEWVIYPQMTAK